MYTHIGHSLTVGYVHAARHYGHADYRGVNHALTGPARPYEGADYRALCGKTVRAGDDGERDRLTVVAVTPDAYGSGVSCKRCRKVIRGK